MGLLDKASKSFSRAGEETVRRIDYDALPQDLEEDEPKEKPVKARKPKEPKPPREPKERRKLNLGSAAKNLLPEKRSTTPHEIFMDEDNELPDHEADLDELMAAPVEPKKLQTIDTAFEIDESEPNFYEQKQELWDGETKKNDVPELISDNGAIQDVLDVLKIPATFTIREDILMPTDFEDVDFDIQVPQGYDVGQVQFFVERVEASVKEYLKLLELRNEHIAKLATAVDRLQVDANNLKYDNQIAAGIGIIPTSDSVDLENENMELKLQLQKLKDAQRTTLNSEERKIYEGLRNEFSKIQRDNEDLTEKNFELQNRIAQMEENADEMDTMPSAYSDHDSAEIIFETMDDELPPMDDSSLDDELPDLSSAALPDFSMPQPSKPPVVSNSSFDVEDDDEDFLNSASQESEPSPITYLEDDDEEDELDQLMRDWKN